MDRISGLGRARWAAIGAAVAVTVGAGGLVIAHATNTPGSTGFVPITPCRLIDTRAESTVGARNVPLGGGETFTAQVTGTNGNCTIPGGASGVAMNVTTVNGTASSFLTAWPADAPQPTASNLNWVAGSPPTPNKVDVKLSSAGKVSFFNSAGSVDVIADVVGFYDAIDVTAGAPAAVPRVGVDANAFTSDGQSMINHSAESGIVSAVSAGFFILCADASVELPGGSKVTAMTADVRDGSTDNDVVVKLRRNIHGTAAASELMATVATTGAPGDVTVTSKSIIGAVVDNNQYTYSLEVCGLRNENVLSDVFIDLT
ncbi:MAG: hypothetical protein JWN39_2084 [Ilumatobacteraceae bacterium]|nr:hypothetical protein [Ilumatobacteraceae bacterium]